MNSSTNSSDYISNYRYYLEQIKLCEDYIEYLKSKKLVENRFNRFSPELDLEIKIFLASKSYYESKNAFISTF